MTRWITDRTDDDVAQVKVLASKAKAGTWTEEEQAEKEKVMEAALENAAEAPLCIMKTIVDTMEMIRVLGEKGSRLAVSDAGVAILFAQAALEGASLNIFINTKICSFIILINTSMLFFIQVLSY